MWIYFKYKNRGEKRVYGNEVLEIALTFIFLRMGVKKVFSEAEYTPTLKSKFVKFLLSILKRQVDSLPNFV